LTFEIGAENTFVLLRSEQRLPELEISASGGQKKREYNGEIWRKWERSKEETQRKLYYTTSVHERIF
jgi:hypothetical protein